MVSGKWPPLETASMMLWANCFSHSRAVNVISRPCAKDVRNQHITSLLCMWPSVIFQHPNSSETSCLVHSYFQPSSFFFFYLLCWCVWRSCHPPPCFAQLCATNNFWPWIKMWLYLQKKLFPYIHRSLLLKEKCHIFHNCCWAGISELGLIESWCNGPQTWFDQWS